MTFPSGYIDQFEVNTEDTTIFVRRFGSGPGLLLLHGFPQTQGSALYGGHFFPEAAPEETAGALYQFFKSTSPMQPYKK